MLPEKFNWKEALTVQDFKAQTLAQLQKDIDRAQCSITINSENYIEDLSELLANLSEEKRAQLLYLIDLPEYSKIMPRSSDDFLKLAEQIIHREALKVYWRSKFSS